MSSICTPAPPSRDPERKSCARSRRVGTFRTFTCHSALSASRSQKAGQLTPSAATSLQMSGCDTVSCRALLALPFTITNKRLSRGPYFVLWFAGVVMCGRNSPGARATGQSLNTASLEG